MNSDQKQKVRFFSFAVSTIFLAALFLRLIGLQKGLWLDEIYSVNVIHANSLHRMIASLKYDVHPPLFYLLLRGWSFFFKSESGLRLLSVILGAATVLLTILWLKAESLPASLLAGSYIATLPVMLHYSQEIRQYALLTFLFTLGLFVCSRLAHKAHEKKLYAVLALIFSLTVATHFIAILLLVPSWMYFLLISENKEIHWNSLAGATVLPCLVFLFCFFFLTRLGHERSNWMPPPDLTLGLSISKYLSGYAAVPSPFGWLFLFTGVLVALGSWRLSLPFLLPVILFVMEVLICCWMFTSIFMFHNFIPILVPVAAFVSIQISTIPWRLVRSLAVVCFMILCILFSYGWARYEAGVDPEGTQEIAKLLATEQPPPQRIIFYPSWTEMAVRYYAPELPQNNLLEFTPEVSADFLTAAVHQFFSRFRQQPVKVFLVLRADPLERKHPDTFNLLVTLLKSETGRPLIIEAACMRNASRIVGEYQNDRHSQLLSRMEESFGKPVSFADFGNYTFCTYKLEL